ncbi:cytochrome c-type biogenesis protein CcmH [Sphingomonas sp. NBWT7]|uniref:cytochrome c-type biogenesis protein n=1 Tax=Sphingomonas sp. NBWT7 TaxID=2596913 RepID=UPI001624D4F3|nr:cytochrome c-type biogenesis protein [Sphingomonas sp. NBWT7]QNE32574.1 cytochrome c-type biogenesis protein CcmH [Sphingomonas sp. NBWT7]
MSGAARLWQWLALALALAVPAAAQTRPAADYANVQLRDPAKEAEAAALMATLRCLVCQGQSIADSDADMAGDMRSLVRQRVAAGESPAEVRDWLIARYGDYVTYDPPMSAVTLPLWLAPLALLAIGAWIARASFRRRKRPGDPS